jgi:hypothetical protein
MVDRVTPGCGQCWPGSSTRHSVAAAAALCIRSASARPGSGAQTGHAHCCWRRLIQRAAINGCWGSSRRLRRGRRCSAPGSVAAGQLADRPRLRQRGAPGRQGSLVLVQLFLQHAECHAGVDEIGLDGQCRAQRLLGFRCSSDWICSTPRLYQAANSSGDSVQCSHRWYSSAARLAGRAHQACQADQLHGGQRAAPARRPVGLLASIGWRQGPGSVPVVAIDRWVDWSSCWHCRLNPSRIQSSPTKVQHYAGTKYHEPQRGDGGSGRYACLG